MTVGEVSVARRLQHLAVLITSLCAIGFLSPATGCGNGSSNSASAGNGSGTGGASGSPSGTGTGTGSGSGSGAGSGSGSSSGSTSAWVYVSTPSVAGSPGNTIAGYAAASDGTLTQVSGSPFSTTGQASAIGATGKYLFVAEGGNIVSYTIGSDGSLSAAATTNAQANDTPSSDGFPATLFTDPSGDNLYDEASAGCNLKRCYQAFSIEASGGLQYLGTPTYSSPADPYLSFTANDAWAYGSDYVNGDTANFYAFTRGSTGALTYFNPNANLPAAAANQEDYVPFGAATQGNGYVVIALQNGAMPLADDLVQQLAVYTINPQNGTLSTANTAADMPKISVGSAEDYRFDPTGTWLAVGGDGGVQIFKFSNGVLTSSGSYTGQNNAVTQLAWDGAGHLYTLGQDSGLLWVYNVANGVPTPASGSPYTVPDSSYLAVEPVP